MKKDKYTAREFLVYGRLRDEMGKNDAVDCECGMLAEKSTEKKKKVKVHTFFLTHTHTNGF